MSQCLAGSEPLINLNEWPLPPCPQRAPFKHSVFLLLYFHSLVLPTLDKGKGVSITYTQILWNLKYALGLRSGDIRRGKPRNVQGLQLAEIRGY